MDNLYVCSNIFTPMCILFWPELILGENVPNLSIGFELNG
jgi:hypothetical protein